MKLNHPAYSGTINTGPLEDALYEGVQSRLSDDGINVSVRKIALALTGLYDVPSDSFYAAYDNEVSALRRRYLGIAGLESKEEK